MQEIKHPYYDYTLSKSLDLARSIKFGPLPDEHDPTPTTAEALEILTTAVAGCNFNWITGHVALNILDHAVNGTEMTTV